MDRGIKHKIPNIIKLFATIKIFRRRAEKWRNVPNFFWNFVVELFWLNTLKGHQKVRIKNGGLENRPITAKHLKFRKTTFRLVTSIPGHVRAPHSSLRRNYLLEFIVSCISKDYWYICNQHSIVRHRWYYDNDVNQCAYIRWYELVTSLLIMRLQNYVCGNYVVEIAYW